MKKIVSIALAGLLVTVPLIDVYGMDNENTVVNEEASSDVNEALEEDALPEVMELSLEEAISYALEHNRDMKIQDLNIDKAQIGYDSNIRLVKQYNKMKDMPSIPSYMMPARTEPVEPDAVVNTKLLDNGAIEKSLDLSLNVPKWNKELKINEITYNVQKGYYDLALAERSVQIAKEGLELTNTQYEKVKKMLDAGVIAQQDLLATEVAVSQSQSGYDAAQMGYEMQRMSFNNILGLPLDQQVVLTDDIEYKEYEEINLEESISEALENNAALKVLTVNHEIEELTLEATKARYPEITFRYRDQEVAVELAAKSLETAKSGIEMGVRATYLQLITAEKQIKTYEKTVERAEQALELAELSFELGQNTSTDISQARLEVMNAKTNLANQIHAYNTALLDFKYSTGLGKSQIGAGY